MRSDPAVARLPRLPPKRAARSVQRMTSTLAIRLAVAALVGLAVGVEREWSGHVVTGPDPRFAGVRTFTLLGTIGGIAGWLAVSGYSGVGVALVAGPALLVAAAYWAAARGGGSRIDGTTEVAAMLVLALGALAGMGELAVASGSAAVAVLALSEKTLIRGAVERLGGAELRAALHFAVLALVVLPALPDRSFGPLGGVNPRALWIVVLIFSGLNFAGFVARRVVGVSRGYGVTGAIGGMISSTAVSLQFSRLSRTMPDLAVPLGIGVVAASTVLLPRVLLVSTVLNPHVSRALLPYFVAPIIVGATMVGFLMVRALRQPRADETDTGERSPLDLWSAVKMTLAFQGALMALSYMRTAFGSAGVLVSAALLGLTDMDALTLSMSRIGTGEADVALAARAIAIGAAANSVLKLAITLVLGAPRFRAVASWGLLLLLVAGVTSLALIR